MEERGLRQVELSRLRNTRQGRPRELMGGLELFHDSCFVPDHRQ